MFDSVGLIHQGREGLPASKQQFMQEKDLSLAKAMEGADCFIGCSARDIINQDMVKKMAANPIIFACANPDPEIPYPEAKAARPDAIVATGRSDFPNQVNNVLGFPFLFRAALDCKAERFTEGMKIAAAKAVALLARTAPAPEVLEAYGLTGREFGVESLLPLPFDLRLAEVVPPAVVKAANNDGVAQKHLDLAAYPKELRKRMTDLRQRLNRII